jgi:type IV pilus assembly protein PilB
LFRTPAYDAWVARLRIGELLVEAKVITHDQLEGALEVQRANGRKLGQVLTELGLINETQLTQALSRQLSVPWVSLYHIDFSRQLLSLVPRDIAERYGLVPIYVRRVRKQGDTLYVAMDDPTHEAALAAVSKSAGLPVRPMIACPSDIRSAIRVYYTGEGDAAAPSEGEATVSRPSQAPPPPPPEPRAQARRAPKPATLPSAEARNRVSSEVDAQERAASVEEPPRPPARSLPDADSPDAWPEVEARAMEMPVRKGGPRLVALTLLDGTKVLLPARPRKNKETPSPPAPDHLTARDLISALRAVSQGADTREILGEKVPLDAIVAALMSILLKKGLIADWEFVDELRKT